MFRSNGRIRLSSQTRSSKADLLALKKTRIVPQATLEASTQFFTALDCPRSLTCSLLLNYGELQQLVDLEVKPSDYNSHKEFTDAYRATHFLSKYQGFSLDVSKKTAAMEKFWRFEQQCKRTNLRFRDLSRDPFYNGEAVWLHDAVRRKIAKVLGNFDPEELRRSADWGPGASTLIKSDSACAANKFQCETGITRDCYQLVSDALLSQSPMWTERLLEAGFPKYCVGNEITTVEKSSKIDRVIAKEPGINLWFQKSIGTMIKRRLKKWGINLYDQTQNQTLCQEASISGLLSTVDFSSASDSIATNLVRDLLPARWFAVLDALRSHYGVDEGSLVPIRWEKFSSMGNGFTFELMSLIFYAIASAVDESLGGGSTISVFGDDVVISTSLFQQFSSMTSFYGFTINHQKSYSDGYFRESCGAHFIEGQSCKPIYLRDKLSDTPSVFRLANAVRRLSHDPLLEECDAKWLPLWNYLVQLVPEPLRLGIPAELGDGGFIGNFDEVTPQRAPHQIEGFVVRHVVERSIPFVFDGVGNLLAYFWRTDAGSGGPLTTLDARQCILTTRRVTTRWAQSVRSFLDKSGGASDSTVSRRGLTSVGFTRSIVLRWYNLGPWVS